MTIIDALEDLWTKILDVTALFVTPDWNAIVAMLPILIFIGSSARSSRSRCSGSVIYLARKPRVKVRSTRARASPRSGPTAQPIFPPGLPYCRRHSLIYPSGIAPLRARDNDLLAVTCPMCGLGRDADDRHLRELRPRPQGEDAGAVAVRHVRPQAGRRRGRLSRAGGAR